MAKKSTIEQLTEVERRALVNLHGTKAYEALVHMRDIEVTGLAADALLAPDMEQVKYLKGQVVWANNLVKLLDDLFEKSKQKS